ncbi:tyrosine-protein phosphatase [Croceivirga thetidis]|uniref:protein-tyrosine-phosphatase n=1 Tax=Croceivirga thetidis TaxID=2721623 RepID=A0ABX1GT03_9FLAO|nr:CpsB/CapC family capsule biosynthesis tyrosine phosphatase [Croceivirga thetidis]NKI32025.1 histidinol phosphatase [Croceivirga thetidis]
MFSFFTKKDFLVDYLEGFVDIHNHILPGIDDGAKNVEESIEIIKEFREIGVNSFICTPHIMNNYYENTPDIINKAYNRLLAGIKKEGLNVNIVPAAEHMIDDNFENILSKNEVMPLGKDHLLVEMSFLQPSINFEIAVNQIQSKRLFPVLAHPERYSYYHKDFSKFEYFKNLGIKFQLNILSLGDYYGKDVRKTALKLLEKDMYDFIGSDVHFLSQIKHIKRITLRPNTISKVQNLISNKL